MITLLRAILDRWLWWALAGSALMLAAAHAFETFGGYQPCTLCLRQREVYWVAGTVTVAGLLGTRLPSVRRWRWLFHLALAAIFLVGMGIAVWHAGAEWKWWPGPKTCSGTGAGVSLDALSAIADGTAKIRPPACDEAAWRMFGLSMAGWNVLISLKLAAYSIAAFVIDRRTR